MTIPASSRRAGPFSGNASATSFPFAFKVFASTDVQVQLVNASGVISTLTQGVDYSVTLNGDQTAAPGGSITYPVSGSPLPVGWTLTILGARQYLQDTSLPGAGTFSPTTIETALDKQAILSQQLLEQVDRALTLPATIDPAVVSATLPTPTPNGVIGWSSTGDALVNRSVTDLVTSAAYSNWRTDTFTGTGLQTVFVLGADPGSVNNCDIAVGGITQTPGVDFTVSGTSLTFTSAPPLGATICARYGQALAVGTASASQVQFSPAGTGAVATDVQTKLREFPSVRDFKALGDGVTDDTAALQAALDSNKLVFLPPGKYRITSPLQVSPTRNRNCGFVSLTAASRYPYTTQSGGPAWTGAQEAVIFYDGAASSTAAVIAASPTAVGTEPATTFDTTIWTLILQDVTLDANGKAGYGLFTARVQNLQLDRLRARGATVAGVSVNGTYSGSARGVRCYLNPGRGFEEGAADSRFGWTAQDKVNAFYIYDLHCDANGSAATFRESDTTLRKEGCGVYFGPHRSAHIYGVIAENNFGANIVFEPSGSSNTIHGVYTELGCKYAPGGAGTDAISLGYATKQWGLIFVGATAALNCRVADGVFSLDNVWLTGTQPTSTRQESAFELQNISLAAGLTAEWGNYRLTNCSLELENITGTAPVGAFTIRGGLQFGAGTNALSVYTEGTWTPAFAGTTTAGTGWAYSVQAGEYTRIGRHVFFSGRITLSAVSADATGQIAVTGLPFTVKNSNGANSSVQISAAINLTTAVVQLDANTSINNTRFTLQKRTAAATSASSVVLADLSATTSITFSGHYVV